MPFYSSSRSKTLPLVVEKALVFKINSEYGRYRANLAAGLIRTVAENFRLVGVLFVAKTYT